MGCCGCVIKVCKQSTGKDEMLITYPDYLEEIGLKNIYQKKKIF